jgi:hypothetical protein
METTLLILFTAVSVRWTLRTAWLICFRECAVVGCYKGTGPCVPLLGRL